MESNVKKSVCSAWRWERSVGGGGGGGRGSEEGRRNKKKGQVCQEGLQERANIGEKEPLSKVKARRRG